MVFFKINNNPEKRKLEEMKQVALLTSPENKALSEFIIDWNKALEIMGKSEFKEDYAPEDAKDEISERVYQHLKKRSNNGCSKSSLDILLNKGENGYEPLIKILPSSLSADEIYLYCFNKEINPHVENINKITGYMRGAVEKGEFDASVLFDFDAAVNSIDKLVSDFKYKTVIENELETYRTAIEFGINMLATITSSESEKLAKDEAINIYNCAKEIIKKYAKKCDMETDKQILKIDAGFNQKIKDFKKSALKHQDELYNAAIEKAEALERSYEISKNEFVAFSLAYSIILEEDGQSIQNALEEIDNAFRAAYGAADEAAREKMWEAQNPK